GCEMKGAALHGEDAGVGNEVHARPDDLPLVRRYDDRTVHLRELRETLWGEVFVDLEAARRHLLNDAAVAQDDERSGLRAQDTFEAVAQPRSRRDRFQRRAQSV